MSKKKIQQAYYAFLSCELEPALHRYYGKNICLFEDRGFCVGSFKECKSITKFNNEPALFCFIKKCLKKSHKYEEMMQFYSELEVKEFIQHLKTFVTDRHYSEQFNILRGQHLHHQCLLDQKFSGEKLPDRCKSLFNIHPSIANNEVLNSRSEIASKIVTSDQNLFTISILPGILILLIGVSMLLNFIFSKFKLYLDENQELPANEFTEGDIDLEEMNGASVRHRISRF